MHTFSTWSTVAGYGELSMGFQPIRNGYFDWMNNNKYYYYYYYYYCYYYCACSFYYYFIFYDFFLRAENIQLHHPNLKLNLRSHYKRLVDFPLGWWNQPVQRQGLHWRRKETEREKLLQVKYYNVNSRSCPSSKTLTFIARLSAKPLFWKWVFKFTWV